MGLRLSLVARGAGAARSPTRYPDAVPSYRVTATIGALRPGTNPESVLPTAADAGRERTTVEAWDLAIVRGEARITIRFVAEDTGVRRLIDSAIEVKAPFGVGTVIERFIEVEVGKGYAKIQPFLQSYLDRHPDGPPS